MYYIYKYCEMILNNVGSKHKVLKYELKLSKAVNEKNHKETKKYIEHLKYHILEGGNTKYNFKDIFELLKNKNIDKLKKSSLNNLQTFIIGNLGDQVDSQFYELYYKEFKIDEINKFIEKLKPKLDEIIKIGCKLEIEPNSGAIGNQPGYSQQCFWISIIDYLKTKNIIKSINEIRNEAEIDDKTNKLADTNFNKFIYIYGANKVAKKYDLTIVIYNVQNSEIIDSKVFDPKKTIPKIEDRDLYFTTIGNGKNIVILASKSNSHFELIKNIKCTGETTSRNLLNLIWQDDKIINNDISTKTETIKSESEILKSICPDADECIAFGREEDKINNFFGNFKNFDYIKEFKTIGAPSKNGFIKEISYEKDGYKSNAILKSSSQNIADSLYYEYLVGEFINTQLIYFPCFIKTYGIYKYKDDLVYNNIKQCSKIEDCNIDDLKSGLIYLSDANTDIDKYLEISCENPTHMAILMQSIKGSITLYEQLKNGSNVINTNFIKDDLLYVLYQIYMPLSYLADKFTHHDLHYNNVLLYEPVKDSYIQYIYHIDTGDVSFKSPYMAKIIDYGRSYFNNGKILPLDIYKKICDITKCNDDNWKSCGDNKGFFFLNPASTYIAKPFENNKTTDIRLFNIISDFIKTELKPSTYLNDDELKKFYVDAGYNLSELLFKLIWYSTPQIVYSGLPDNINNVTDAYKSLEELILKQENIDNNDKLFEGKRKLGDLHIYSDGKTPAKFIPSN